MEKLSFTLFSHNEGIDLNSLLTYFQGMQHGVTYLEVKPPHIKLCIIPHPHPPPPTCVTKMFKFVEKRIFKKNNNNNNNKAALRD